MIIFDSDVTHDIEELGYSVELNPATGAEVRFVKGSHMIELYFEDDEFFVYSESTERKKSDEGYMFNESVGLSKKELQIIEDIITMAWWKLTGKRLEAYVNGG